ncbi:hypothetical protein NQZ79_g1657 [Umbelopsis isabellina]|nr:hypothetical protein NQZ79_g1657 [Umbelopsis isabellina]
MIRARRLKLLWSKRTLAVIIATCLLLMIIALSWTDPVPGYREKVQSLVAMDWTDEQITFSNKIETHYNGKPIDFSPENRWNDSINEYVQLTPLDEQSMSRPYSYVWRQQQRAWIKNLTPYCQQRYGFGILENWKSNTQPMCKPTACLAADQATVEEQNSCETSVAQMAGSINTINSSKTADFSMICSMIHLDIPENLCHAKNLILDVDKLPQELPIRSIDMFLSPGSLGAKCQLEETMYEVGNWGFGAARWLQSGLSDREVVEEQAHENTTCDAWVESDLYLVSRYDLGNVYHIHQDLMQAFIGLAAQDMNVETTEMVFLDSDKGGISAAKSLWNSLFVGKSNIIKPIRTIREVIHDVQKDAVGPVKNVCFRSTTFGFHAGVTLFSREKGEQTECQESTMLKSFVDWVLYQLDLPLNFNIPANPDSNFTLDTFKLITPPNTDQPTTYLTDLTDVAKKPLVVTFLSRNPTSQKWPPNAERMIRNEIPFLDHMQYTLENHFVRKQKSRGLVFRRINPADIPTMQEQIALARESDIIIGPHGAGLIYTSYIPPYGGVIELQHPSRRFNYQFSNIAALTGPKIYRQANIRNSIRDDDSKRIEAQLLEVVDLVLRRMDNE